MMVGISKSDALAMLMDARDIWAAGDNERALELVNAALERLVSGGHCEETMPTTFGLIHRIRDHLIAEGAGQ